VKATSCALAAAVRRFSPSPIASATPPMTRKLAAITTSEMAIVGAIQAGMGLMGRLS
jgi:hypothetical protein